MYGGFFYSRQSRHTGFLTSVTREYFRCHYRVILQRKRHCRETREKEIGEKGIKSEQATRLGTAFRELRFEL